MTTAVLCILVNQESDKQITPRHHKKGIEEAGT